MKTKVAFIINSKRNLTIPVAKTFTLAKSDTDLVCEFFNTENHKHAILLARDSVNNGFDCIVAVGGDGTSNEVLNGIKLAKRSLGVYMGIIPNGTGNDFQVNLGKFVPEQFIHNLKNRKAKGIDIIYIKSKEDSKYALNIAGVGFDGYVIQTLQGIRQNWMLNGRFAYIISILRTFIFFKKPMVKVKGDDFKYNGKLLLLAACNGSTFGHGLVINPRANISDGKLNVTLIGNATFLDYLKNIKRLRKGLLIDHPEAKYYQTTKVSVEVSKKQLYIEADGEIFGTGTVSFEILKNDIFLIS